MNELRQRTRGLSEPGLGLPRPGAPPHSGDRGARRLAVAAALVLLAIAAWTVWAARPLPGATPGWEVLAPPASVPMHTWRWLVFTTGPLPGAHFAVGPAPDRDPARIEVLPAWSLQQPVGGYPDDAIVVAVSAPAGQTVVEARLADLAATLVARVPTLSLLRAGADRIAPPPGLDPQRLRYRVRELLMARGQPAR